MNDFELKISEDKLSEVIKTPEFLLVARRLEQGDNQYIIDYIDLLFDKETTDKLLKKFKSYEELTDFLQPAMEQINSYIVSTTKG